MPVICQIMNVFVYFLTPSIKSTAVVLNADTMFLNIEDNNIVFKYNVNGENYFAKFYNFHVATHIDNEVLIYNNIC